MREELLKNKIKLKNYKASALVYILVILFIVSIIITSLLGYITSQLRFSINRVNKEESFQVAEAGVFWYRWYLAHQTSGKTAQQIANFWNSNSPVPVGTQSGGYTTDYKNIGQYKLEVTKPDAWSTIVIVKSTGWTYREPNLKRIVEVRFRRPSWSEYIFLSNSFINFGDQAEVYGKVFSNNGIRFDGLAHNTVSSLLPSFNDPTWGGNRLQFGVHTTRNPADPDAPSYPWPSGTVPNRPDIFMGGRTFPVQQVSFTGVTTDLANTKTQAQAGSGRYFDTSGAGRKILLKSNGTYDVCTVNSKANNLNTITDYLGVIWGATGTYSATNGNACTTSSCCAGAACPYIQNNKQSKGRCVTLSNYPIVNNGVIFVENNAWVDGAVSGKRITVVAANLSGGNQANMFIGTESSNFSVAAYDCNNVIGLVAQNDLRVLGSCPNNYTVDAALLAQNGTVGINDNGFGSHSALIFNGAIASYLQPYFQNGNSGFAVRTYNYNNNLLYCPPPYFPTGSDYAIDLWQEL
jgi:hypothetical protein